MTNEPSVLIVSTVADVATDHVVQRLRELGVAHRRLNTESFPFSTTISFELDGASCAHVVAGGEDVGQPSAIWYRRVRTPERPEGMEPGVYDFCLQETRAALLGSILSLKGRWMSAPQNVWRAEFKPLQLAIASEVGLKVPPTFITNDAKVVRRAFSSLKSMIVKPAMSGHVVFGGQEHAIYTSKLLEQHLEHLDQAKLSPAIYQGLVEKRFDIRATVVGDKVLAAAIFRPGGQPAIQLDGQRYVAKPIKGLSASIRCVLRIMCVMSSRRRRKKTAMASLVRAIKNAQAH